MLVLSQGEELTFTIALNDLCNLQQGCNVFSPRRREEREGERK